jgi:hypothetical protein
VSFQAGRPLVEGAAANLTDVHLQRGARVEAGTLRLQGRWDALFLRVTSEARRRPLELRAVGRGSGTLYVGEASFWSPTPRWRAYPMDGAFRIVHRYEYATSGGGDLLVSLGKGGGEASLARVALLSPGDPDDVQPPR